MITIGNGENMIDEDTARVKHTNVEGYSER